MFLRIALAIFCMSTFARARRRDNEAARALAIGQTRSSTRAQFVGGGFQMNRRFGNSGVRLSKRFFPSPLSGPRRPHPQP